MYIHISISRETSKKSKPDFRIETLRCHVVLPGDGYEVVAAGTESTSEIFLLAAQNIILAHDEVFSER